eukprot:TRINITY_DN109945_c0_g1_i1.p1 TRINITY_DN109945_c0_g1~~TRINITY_DN109945_c0_g1_i1.p1  ORF type:complete len:542 (+),score=88.65 TRINITY_DN109945_c0_g1_i1:65-1690(+)
MIDYRAGTWGFMVACGPCNGSLVPKSLVMAIPNGLITWFISTMIRSSDADDIDAGNITPFHEDTASAAMTVITAFTTIMTFILYNRSRTSYNRWWEGGTLLQKTRGEWFNAYSSIMAFTSTKPELQSQVEEYTQCLARLMSLLMCCGLQQVSPNRDRPFEIIDLEGIDPESMEFLNSAPDKVEVILQWIQRSMILHMQTGVLPVAPPILSRAFQEVSRGIVNLQNARKIADFPYPYPLAQISMILQILHWCVLPIGASMAMPRMWASLFSFCSIFVLWCIHFNAIELEFPFGSRTNDLPMIEFQQDWNNSICTLLDKKASTPPGFAYDPNFHDDMAFAMSDASELYMPTFPVKDKGKANIKISSTKHKHGKGGAPERPEKDDHHTEHKEASMFKREAPHESAPPLATKLGVSEKKVRALPGKGLALPGNGLSLPGNDEASGSANASSSSAASSAGRAAEAKLGAATRNAQLSSTNAQNSGAPRSPGSEAHLLEQKPTVDTSSTASWGVTHSCFPGVSANFSPSNLACMGRDQNPVRRSGES